jgi:Protein of unknown function (DUF3592)
MSRSTTPTWLFALSAAIFCVVSMGMFAIGRNEQTKSAAFMSVARPAMGKFIGYVMWHEKDTGFSSRVRGRAVPEIEFKTEAGQTVRFAAISSGNTMFEARKSEYPVLYDPSNPSRAQLDAGLDTAFWIDYASSALFVVIAVIFMVLWMRRLQA